MSTVDPTQVEKIVSLLQGNKEYQNQAIEVLIALANPNLTKQFGHKLTRDHNFR